MSRAWGSNRGGNPQWRRLRALVLAENMRVNGGMCVLCNQRRATVAGHIVAKCKGGADALHNLRGECSPCSNRGGGQISQGTDADPPHRTSTAW